jgi:hypothetical protein
VSQFERVAEQYQPIDVRERSQQPRALFGAAQEVDGVARPEVQV